MNTQDRRPPAGGQGFSVLKLLAGAIAFAVAYFGVRYIMSGGH
jgi:hypothetical protein